MSFNQIEIDDEQFSLIENRTKINADNIEIIINDVPKYQLNTNFIMFENNNNNTYKLHNTNLEEINELLLNLLKINDGNYLLTVKNNRLTYIFNENKTKHKLINNKYVASGHTYESIIEFITTGSNEEIINYIENVDNLKYTYASPSPSLEMNKFKPVKLIDIIFYYNANIDLLMYIFDHYSNNDYYTNTALMYLFSKQKLEIVKIILQKCNNDSVQIFNLISLCGCNGNEFFSQFKTILLDNIEKYEIFNYIVMNSKYTSFFLRNHINYLYNSQDNDEYKFINYVKNQNLISMMYDDNLEMIITDNFIDFDKIYFLRTNKIDIVNKCKNLVYLEYENNNIDGLSNVDKIFGMYKFKNCNINYELLAYLLNILIIREYRTIHFEFQNCIIDEFVLNKIKFLKSTHILMKFD